jgi:diguanylate cyclase (GGDEF)-like protein
MDNTNKLATTDQPTLQELQGLRLFEGIDLEPIYELLADSPIRYLQPEEVLLVPDECNDTLYLILAGECAVHLHEPDGEPFAVYGPGESVGELSLIDDQPVSAFVIANTSCRLLALDRRTFWTLAGREDGFARNLLVTLANRLRDTNRAIREQGRDSGQALAEYDALTGLPTRSWFLQALTRQIDHCRITQRAFSVLVVEVAHFEELIETYGEAAGEAALRGLADVLKNTLRPTDRPARCEECGFIALLPHTDADAARIAAERVREAMSESVLMLPDNSILPSISVDYGAAAFEADSTPESLVEAARGDQSRRRARLGKRYR